jgi:threonine/homoserine/homoserine lactone efflux protein
MNGFLFALVLAAAIVGSLHTMAPDHWMPFAALARARRWSAMRTARTTILCGFGHVTVSAALGIAALFVGLGVIKAIGSHLENQANSLLMSFGAVYLIWGIVRSLRRDPHSVLHPHDHHHAHGHHDHDHGLTEWSLFLLFSADPCVAVIPMIMAAASGGWAAVAAVVVTYEVATIATMVVLVAGAHAGARAMSSPWIDRYGHAAAGALIVSVGAAMALLGV